MVQSDLHDELWDCAKIYQWYLRNVHDKVADDKTVYDKRDDVIIDGLLIPSETKVSYMSISLNDETRVHQWDRKMLPEYKWNMDYVRENHDSAIRSARITKT